MGSQPRAPWRAVGVRRGGPAAAPGAAPPRAAPLPLRLGLELCDQRGGRIVILSRFAAPASLGSRRFSSVAARLLHTTANCGSPSGHSSSARRKPASASAYASARYSLIASPSPVHGRGSVGGVGDGRGPPVPPPRTITKPNKLNPAGPPLTLSSRVLGQPPLAVASVPPPLRPPPGGSSQRARTKSSAGESRGR